MTETMTWHCCDCKTNFQGPKVGSPPNGCEKCGSNNIFDCNIEYIGEVIPYPIVTSHQKCEKCGKEMRNHGYIESLNMAVCL